MPKGFYFLKALERSRKVSPNIPVNMGSLARHETLVLGVRLRPPKNFLNFCQYFRTSSSTCQKFRQVHTFSSILQKLSTGFYKTSSTMWTISCKISETLTKCAQRDHTNELPSILLSPCARLRKIGRTFAKLFRMAVQKINDENRQRQSQRKEPTAQHHTSREQTHHAPSYALPRPPLIPPLVPPLRDVTACCVIRSTVAPCRQ